MPGDAYIYLSPSALGWLLLLTDHSQRHRPHRSAKPRQLQMRNADSLLGADSRDTHHRGFTMYPCTTVDVIVRFREIFSFFAAGYIPQASKEFEHA